MVTSREKLKGTFGRRSLEGHIAELAICKVSICILTDWFVPYIYVMYLVRNLCCHVLGQQPLLACTWFKHILLARTVDIIKQMLIILKLQGLEWKQHAYIIPFLITNKIL